jgi:hypothetical protein
VRAGFTVLNLLKAFQTIPLRVTVWLLYLSPTFESMLSTLSRNTKAYQLALIGFVVSPRIELGSSV